ncbi:hypothetical protein CMQ_7422 [Grosmannia clavigera kw1407]|uniref:Vegetative cell wall protein gp1 n=1 Tax=Grosmannia clavigera (strain kw1407 / UAMH 11150) TaxID=655863 RepID=F0XQH5_GROCL|nr:uncharacterized protein CMQ_7422 [Grosmannia clavigera kw1407]EFX00420.1 hypothetical protein CMQ_7422 [Grosmannia clavigera kw1407]
MNASYSPYAATPAATADYYYEKKDYISPSPTPSPRGPAYYYAQQQQQRPATRAHFRHMSSSGTGFHEFNTSPSSRPPTFSPRYTSDGHYATANVSSSRPTRRQTSWSSPNAPGRERRSSSFSYYRASDSIGESDEDELIEIDGITYVLPARSRPRKQKSHYLGDDYNYSGPYRTNHQYYPQGGYGFVEKDLRAGFESPRYHEPTSDTRHTTPTGHSRRSSTTMPIPQRSATARPSSSHQPPPPATMASSKKSGGSASPAPQKATEADAKKHHIPAGYSLKNWDPSEEPIMLLGSVFDANSLGKWIYDWTTYHHGPSSPIAEVAGEMWLLLIQLAGKIKRADEVMCRVRTKENREMLEDFILSGERLTDKLRKLLKTCEQPMLRTGKREKTQLGKNAGIEFVETLFGRERELEKTERFMQSVRLWNLRFDANCEDIIRQPTK